MSACANCGTSLAGAFCHHCGQKRFADSDRRFGHLLHQLVASATDLDGRLWRTLRALLFQPGLLSREYMQGRRARWISPISLFLAVSVVYFLAPMRGGDLTLRFNEQVSAPMRALAVGADETLSTAQRARTGQSHSAITSRWIERRVAAREAAARAASGGALRYTYADYRIAYDARADEVSKALIILHVPFAALALMLLFVQQRRYFAEHCVVGLHYLTFLIVALQVMSLVIHLAQFLPPPWQPPFDAYDWIMRALMPAYAVLMLRRAYGVGWIMAIVAATAMLSAMVLGNLHVWRAVQFAVTFLLT